MNNILRGKPTFLSKGQPVKTNDKNSRVRTRRHFPFSPDHHGQQPTVTGLVDVKCTKEGSAGDRWTTVKCSGEEARIDKLRSQLSEVAVLSQPHSIPSPGCLGSRVDDLQLIEMDIIVDFWLLRVEPLHPGYWIVVESDDGPEHGKHQA